jgi:hypothetical protein
MPCGGFIVHCIHILFKSIFYVMSLMYSPWYHTTLSILHYFDANDILYKFIYLFIFISTDIPCKPLLHFRMYGWLLWKHRSCDGCLSDRCDSEHGICTDLSGCKPGWKPRQPKCDLGILIKKILFYQKVTDKFICFHNA